MNNQPREEQPYWLSSKIDSRIWVNFTRNGLRLGSRHQEPPHRRLKEFAYSCRQRHLTWAKEKKNCCPVVQSPLFRWEQALYFIWKPWSESLEGWRSSSPKLLEVQCEVSTVCDDLGCNVICWCWSIVFFENQCHCTRLPRHFGALYASFCWPAF